MQRTTLFSHCHAAIIGGGPNAVSHLYEILKYAQKNKITAVTIYEKSKTIGPGRAWRLDQHFSLTSNDPLGGVILFNDKPNDFANWFKANVSRLKNLYPELITHVEDCATGRERFPARKIVGLYITDRYQELLAQAKEMNIQVHEKTETEIVDAKKDSAGCWELYSAKKEKFTRTHFIYAGGTLPPDKNRHLIGYPNYHPEALEEKELAQINPTQNVVILGSNVTAVDTVKLLMEQKHQGYIYIVSPSGHLPRVKGRPGGPANKFKFLTPENLDQETLKLDDVLALAAKEISHASGRDISAKLMLKIGSEVGEDYRTTLFNELKRVESGERRPWQWIVGDIYFDVLPIVGRRLKDPKDQDRFIDVILPMYVKWMAGMTEDNARRMLKLMLKAGREGSQGQLQILHGPLGSPLFSGTKTKWQVSTTEKTVVVDYVIDATGPGRNIELSPLLANMTKNGYLQPHRRGGVTVNEKLQIINKDGVPEPRAWATGQSTVASNPAAFGSIEWNAKDAEKVAPQIRSSM